MSYPRQARHETPLPPLGVFRGIGTASGFRFDRASAPAPTQLIDTETAPDWFHDGQLAAWESDAQEVAVIAGTQGGKTAFLPHWLLRELQRCAPFIKELGFGRAIYAGPTLTLLAAQAIPAFQALFEHELGLGKMVMGNKPVFHFSEEGSKKLLGFAAPISVHFAYTNEASNLESMTACCGVWDEAGQKGNKQASYNAFNRRLKAARTAGYGRRAWGTTPYVWNWFKTQIHDRAERGEPGFELFRFASWMNPLITEAECRLELERGMPLWEWEMMYLGLYTKPAGAIYSCFDEGRHIVDDFEIPAHWPRKVGIDFGWINTAAVFIALDPQSGKLYLYREYKAAERTASQHVMALRFGEPRELNAMGGAAQGSEEDKRAEFTAAGLYVAEPPFKDVDVGIKRVFAAFAAKTFATDGNPSPAGGRLLVFRSCTEVIKQLREYAWEVDDEGEPIAGKIANKEKFHYCDALRYALADEITEWGGRMQHRANPQPLRGRFEKSGKPTPIDVIL